MTERSPSPPTPSSPRRRKPKKKRQEPEHPQQGELEEVLARLGEIGRKVFLSKPHARDVVRSLPELDLSLPIDFSGHNKSIKARAKTALSSLDQHLDDAILAHAAFRPGAVYSFFEDRADTEACRPHGPREIFCGYSETGIPQWQPLLAWALDQGRPEFEILSSERPRSVILAVDREDLVSNRMPIFAKRDRVYDIRGQILIGYFRQNGADNEGKFAVTIQIIRSSTRSKVVRLGLNTIGILPDGRGAETLLGSDEPYGFIELLRRADWSLAAINQELKRLDPGLRLKAAAEAATQLLADMASGLKRHDRREQWRTDHARGRAEQQDRPTGMAQADLVSVRFDRLYEDLKEKTWIVLGAKGRTHVFSPEDGRHITSLQVGKKGLETRKVRGRWKALDKPAATAALESIRAAYAAASATSSAAVEPTPSSSPVSMPMPDAASPVSPVSPAGEKPAEPSEESP
ncbi:MAG: hypothetical protein V3W41_03235 [Planctomycetota bacterium]